MRPDKATKLPMYLTKQDMAGFTTLAFLVTQLIWPLPVSAQPDYPLDTLRASVEGVQAGLEDAVLQAAGPEETGVRVELEPLLSGLDPKFQQLLRDRIIPILLESDEEIAIGRYGAGLIDQLKQLATSVPVALVDPVPIRDPDWEGSLIRWINTYLLLPRDMVLDVDVDVASDRIRMEGRIRLLRVDAYELFEYPDHPIPTPLIYTQEVLRGDPKVQGAVQSGHTAFVRWVSPEGNIRPRNEILYTRMEELSHQDDDFRFGFRGFARAMLGAPLPSPHKVIEWFRIKPKSSLRHEVVALARKGRSPDEIAETVSEARAYLRLLAGPAGVEAYQDLFGSASTDDAHQDAIDWIGKVTGEDRDTAEFGEAIDKAESLWRRTFASSDSIELQGKRVYPVDETIERQLARLKSQTAGLEEQVYRREIGTLLDGRAVFLRGKEERISEESMRVDAGIFIGGEKVGSALIDFGSEEGGSNALKIVDINIGKDRETYEATDPNRGLGIGSMIIRSLIQEAIERGLTHFFGLVNNPRILRILYKNQLLKDATVTDSNDWSNKKPIPLDEFYSERKVEGMQAKSQSVSWVVYGRLASATAGLEEPVNRGIRKAQEGLGEFSARHRETLELLWSSRGPGEAIAPTDYFEELPVLMRQAGFREGKLWWIPKGPVAPEALQERPRLKVFIQPGQDAIRTQLRFSENPWLEEVTNPKVKGALLIGDAGFRERVESQLAGLEQSFLQIGPQSVGLVDAELLEQLLTHKLLQAGRIFHAGLEEFIGEGFQVEAGTAIAA